MSFLKLREPLGSSYTVDPDDTLETKTALNRLGYYKPPSFGMTEIPDSPLFEGMKKFQKDNGLFVDGVAKPGGPTESLLNAALAEKSKPRAPQRAKSPGRFPTGGLGVGAPVGGQSANRSSDVEAVRRGLAWAGFYPREKIATTTPTADPRDDFDFDMGLRSFQRRYNLKTDGLVTPAGETETMLARVIGPIIQAEQAHAARSDNPRPPQDRPENGPNRPSSQPPTGPNGNPRPPVDWPENGPGGPPSGPGSGRPTGPNGNPRPPEDWPENGPERPPSEPEKEEERCVELSRLISRAKSTVQRRKQIHEAAWAELAKFKARLTQIANLKKKYPKNQSVRILVDEFERGHADAEAANKRAFDNYQSAKSALAKLIDEKDERCT